VEESERASTAAYLKVDDVSKCPTTPKTLDMMRTKLSQQVALVNLEEQARDEDEGVQLLGAQGKAQISASVAPPNGNNTLQQQQNS
jgi:hypothetical protein